MHFCQILRQRPCLFLSCFLLYAHLVIAFRSIEKHNDSVDDNINTLERNGKKPDPLDLGDGVRYSYCQADYPSAEKHPSPRVANSKLVNVQALIRHGDRSSITFYPRDKDLDWECSSDLGSMSFSETGTNDIPERSVRQIVTSPPDSPFAASQWKGSCDLGQLTLKGALQQRALGRALRGIYIDRFKLLSDHLDPDQLWVRSTMVWRVRQSAENFIEGLYGKSSRTKTTEGLLSTFPILTYPPSVDYLTMPTVPCPRISELQNEQKAPENKVLQRIEQENKSFIETIGDWIGFKGGSAEFVEATMPRSCYGFPLQCRLPSTPKKMRKGASRGKAEEQEEEEEDTNEQNKKDCVTKAMTDRLIDIDSQISAEKLRDDPGAFKILQLGMGSLVKDIRENIRTAVRGGIHNSTSPAFRLYSGHDTTILPMLAVFDSLDMKWPPYASNLLIELWKTPSSNNNNQDQHFVRIFYNSRVLQTKSSWCDLAWCPLDQFVKHLDRFVVADLLAQCKAKTPVRTENIPEVFVNKVHS